MISVAAAIGVPMKLTPWVYIKFNTYYIARLIFLLCAQKLAVTSTMFN